MALLFLRKSCLVTIRQLSIHGNVGTSFLWSDVLPDQNQLGLGKTHWIWQPLQTYNSRQHSVHSSYFQVLGSSVRYSPTRSELVSSMDCSSAGSTFQDRSPISTEHCMLVPFYFGFSITLSKHNVHIFILPPYINLRNRIVSLELCTVAKVNSTPSHHQASLW